MRDEIVHLPPAILWPDVLKPTLKPNSEISRRALVGGGMACAACSLMPQRADAFALGLVEAVGALVTLWNAAKIAYDAYRYFADKSVKVDREVSGFCGCRQVTINHYYSVPNPYGIRGLGTEPGCDFLIDPRRRESGALCLGTPDGAVTLPGGCILALNHAAGDLRGGYGADRTYEYTRPVRYIRRPSGWTEVGPNQYSNEVAYHSARGTVGLRWLIRNPRDRICRGEYFIRDDGSERPVVEGMTPDFYY